MFNNINTRSVTFNLIAVNVVLLIAAAIFRPLNEMLGLHYIFNTHGFVEGSYGFRPYQIITHMFMHGGFLHLLLNMWGLFLFGNILENVWGPKRFLLFYFVTGLGAVVLHMAVQMLLIYNFTGSIDPVGQILLDNPGAQSIYTSNTVGASGAIFGIATAFALLFPNTELMILPFPVPIKAKYLMPVYILIELFQGVSMHQGDNVAHFAHLGGALFGFILVKIWGRNRTRLY